MKRKTLFSFLTIAALGATTALGIVRATPVEPAVILENACTFEWDGSRNTEYRNADNWTVTAGDCTTGTDIPNSADHKVIIKNETNQPTLDLNDGDITIGELVINASATLTVNTSSTTNELLLTSAGKQNGVLTIVSGGTLDVSTGGVFVMVSANVTHKIDGDLVLSTSTSDLKIDADITLDPRGVAVNGGTVTGQNDTAEIIIADGATLTNKIDIVGQMTITEAGGSTGTFFNGSTGVVLANGTASAPAILLIASGLTFDDVSGAKWQAKTDLDAVLKFDVGAACLDGAFLIDNCATIELADNVTIKTNGSFTHTLGFLTIGSSAQFSHSCTNCANCTNITSSQCVGPCTGCS